jgi:ParB/RepB/Spo0J family partition protein
MERTTVKLTKLVAGPNARSDITRVPIDDLVASIPIHGVLNPLIVKKGDKGKFVVHAGGRRLRALNRLYRQDRNYDVPVIIMDDAIDDLDEIALIDNIQRVNLHPVDEYHQYAALIDKGLSQTEIAARFGVTQKWVGQRLQLAKLAPELLKEWRAGKLTADQAAALSANADHATQTTVWEQARRDEWQRRPDRLRQSVRQNATLQSSPSFLLVGAEAYEAAGGTYSDDLFTEDRTILDPALLARLVQKKLADECQRLTSIGWKWAKSELEVGAVWHWPTIDVSPWATADEAIKLTEGSWNEKLIVKSAVLGRMLEEPGAWAKGGVIVGMGNDGAFDYRHFMADEPEGDDDDDDDEGGEPPEVAAGHPEPEQSNPPRQPPAPEPKVNFKLREDMAEILSLAVAEALSQDGAIALAALLATLRQQVAGGFGSRSPLAVKSEPWGPNAPDPMSDAIPWETAFADEVNGRGLDYGHLIGRLVDLRWPQYDPKQWTEIGRKRMTTALCAAVNPEALRAAIEERFDRAAYFGRLPAAKIQAMLAAELGHSGPMPSPKAALVALAARLAADKGWLPPEIAYALPRGDAGK